MSSASLGKSNLQESLLDRLVETSDDNIQGYDIDQLFEKSGGFGRFQWLILLYVMVTYSGTNFYTYNLAYLELMPALKCRYSGYDDFVDCKDSKDVCHRNLVQDWYPNFDDKESFHNWMTEQNLYCKSSFMIGLFGSLYFLGFALNGIYVKQSDRFGRKAILISGSILQAII